MNPGPTPRTRSRRRATREGTVLVLTYTSCATCGRQLALTEGHSLPPVHDGCPPPTDRLNVLRRDYIDAALRDDHAEVERLAVALDSVDDEPPRLLDAALTYASWGWPVFPCRRGLKMPATTHGLNDATTDPEKIRDWWWRWPHANIGLATGHVFDVIDVDPAGAGWWAHLCADHNGRSGPLPDIHGVASTPRPGGQHIYLTATGDGNLAGLVPGVDYRGRGGYVLAPPSVLTPAAYARDTPDGRLRYLWHTYPSPVLKPALAGASC